MWCCSPRIKLDGNCIKNLDGSPLHKVRPVKYYNKIARKIFEFMVMNTAVLIDYIYRVTLVSDMTLRIFLQYHELLPVISLLQRSAMLLLHFKFSCYICTLKSDLWLLLMQS